MDIIINGSQNSVGTNDLVKELYKSYANRLLKYTLKNYGISEDDAWNVVYKTIYRIAEIHDRYHFGSRNKENAFVFKTHINYLRNYFRDNKSFEHRNKEVTLREEFSDSKEEHPLSNNLQLSLLQAQLDKLEAWERILLLMRGQDIPYSEIAKFVSKPEKQLKVYYARLKKQLLVDMNEQLQHLNEVTNEKK